MSSSSSLKVIPRKTLDMKTILETYFVETHEYNGETGGFDILEYYRYEFGPYIGQHQIKDIVHHSILTMAVM